MKSLLMLVGLAAAAAAAEKPRIFITESGAQQVSAETKLPEGKNVLTVTRETSPQNVEVMKAFSRQCPGVVITSNRDKADYVVRFDHEGANPTMFFTAGNKVAIFNKSEELVFSTSTRLLASAVKTACAAMVREQGK